MEDEIESYATQRDGRKRTRLYRELWTLLELGIPATLLPRCSKRAKRLHARLLRDFDRRTDYALQKAIYEVTRYRVRPNAAAYRWGVKPSELRYVRELARHRGGRLGDVQAQPSDVVPAWRASVDEWHDELEVHLTESAYHDIILAATEAYTAARKPTEVYGLCFGTERPREDRRRWVGDYRSRHVMVQQVALQIRARAGHDYVIPNEKTTSIQLEVLEELFPHLELVGDFHSHPYKSHREMFQVPGWKPSLEDERSNRHWVDQMLTLKHRPRLALIAAIAKAERRAVPGYPWRNVFSRTISGVHLVLGAYRIRTDTSYSSEQVRIHAAGLKNPHPYR